MGEIASDGGTLTVWVATVPELGEVLSIDLGQRATIQCHHLTSPANQFTNRNLLHVRV